MDEPNWANRTIWEGDNLPILRGMNAACVDLAYLDPPFNSNKNYAAPIGSEAAGAAFKDTWTLDDLDEAWHNEVADQNLPVYKAIEASEHSHGDGMKSYLIMMAVRLLEIHRVLKDSGSVYLHCDPTASHYLKSLMDAIFGSANFLNDIVWERTIGRSDAQRFARVHDNILYYQKTPETPWYGCWQPLTQKQIERDYRHEDEHGKFQPTSLTTQGLSGGGYTYEFHGRLGPWRYPEDRMMELERNGRIWLPKKVGGWPRYKRYVSESRGIAARDVITDIEPAPPSERLGYPTQKPLALLERFITASTAPGDVILDPFCGCATACVAAERLQREWVGIDISPKAAELVSRRMLKLYKRPLLPFFIDRREDVPKRTDLGPPPPLSESKEKLYGAQGGDCNGCGVHFLPQHLTIDHIIPRTSGGTDHVPNLQLLCQHCNSIKGARPMEYLRARLAQLAA